MITEIKDQNQLKKKRPRQKKLDEIKRPRWAKINKNDFDSLIQDVSNSLDNDELKTTVNKKVYDLKNAEKFLLTIGTQKISEEDAKKLYSDLITPDINELTNVKSKGKYKRNNILNVLENLESVLKGGYWHYKNESLESESESELESEESITERPKLRRQKSAVQPNEQPDTRNMPELERKESAAEQKKKKEEEINKEKDYKY